MIKINKQNEGYLIGMTGSPSSYLVGEEYVVINANKIELSFPDEEWLSEETTNFLLSYQWTKLVEGYSDYLINLGYKINLKITFIETIINWIEVEKTDNVVAIRLNTISNDEFPYSWHEKWSINLYFEKILMYTEYNTQLKIIKNYKYNSDDDVFYMTFEFKEEIESNIETLLKRALLLLNDIHSKVWSELSGFIWKTEYETDEQYFSQDLLFPLFNELGFKDVHYNHGTREFGRDFLFYETNKLGMENYYGVQVKAGNISGSVNSQIDELIGQLTDAYTMPFYTLNSKEPKYISTFIIVNGSYQFERG